ncbi:MAG: hypothetical protein J6L76_06315 [Clostridia bacterium]|nr:hypothetical protein [Clostridia bacterium]
MKRYLSILLVLALMVGLFLPTGSVVATENEATWKTSASGAMILSQSVGLVDDLVVETVQVQFSAKGSYIQLNKKLTDLIGSNGEDGKGYVQFVPGDGSVSAISKAYMLMQLVGSSDTASSVAGTPNGGGMTWYIKGNASYPTMTTSNIFINAGGAGAATMSYGAYADIGAEGYKFAFSTTANGNVALRGAGTGATNAMKSYSSTTGLNSAYKLSEIAGDNGETGEDGVYFRFVSHSGDMNDTQTFTVTVAYPRTGNEKWSLVAGSTITAMSTEEKSGMIIETATVQFTSKGSFIQLNKKLTDLIGKNGQDGNGYIQIIPGDGSSDALAKAYIIMQLVGSKDASSAIAYTPNSNAMTWYPRGNHPATGYATIYLNAGGSATAPKMTYGNHSSIYEDGYLFGFTRKDDGKVYLRSLSDGAATAMKSYDTTGTIASAYQLKDIVGDSGETGEDGVYFRFVSYSGDLVGDTQTFTVTVAYPAPVVPSPSPSATPSATPSETPSATPSETPSATPEGGNNPITGDSGIIFAGLALVICTGVLFYAKKRSSCK